jgi:hypothetical protein
MGGFFILLGVVFILWNRREKKSYYNSILTRRDVKEFITHEPERSWLNAWQIGGRISLIIGIMLAIAGGVLWLVLF